jgi:hypothetical protein
MPLPGPPVPPVVPDLLEESLGSYWPICFLFDVLPV